jgi:SAM-dependent methyltransferase
MKQWIKNRWQREQFLTTPLSILMNPLYILRRGLYTNIRDLAPLIQGKVLDFGCGSKPYESLFTNATSYLGVDIAVSGHNHANSKIDIFYDGKTLPFADNEFDAVVCCEVLEHVFNLDKVLAEISRVLKPEGLALISVPFAWDEHEVPYDFARYTSYGLRHILKNHAYEVIELRKTTTYLLAIFQLLIAYLSLYVLPSRKYIGKLLKLCLIVPLNLLAVLSNAVLPKRYGYFCNALVLARKAPDRDGKGPDDGAAATRFP